MWVVTQDQPFSVVESIAFKRMILCASNGEGKIFGRMSVSRDLDAMHELAVEGSKAKLQVDKCIKIFFLDWSRLIHLDKLM